MLPLPNLDDRNFEQLVREARDLIPLIFPEWTDENAHDPGITLLEMLAWHIEMQQYQLNRLTESHERKFLKLLGESPRDRMPATTSVSFSNASRPMLIPYGTLLRVGELPFETVRAVTVLPDSDGKVYVQTADGIQEEHADFASGNSPFYPFGERPEPGSRMIVDVGQPLPKGSPLSLWFQLVDQEPDIRIPARYKFFTPNCSIEWSYWNERENGEGEWLPLPVERDESYCLHQSGPVLFEIPEDAGHVTKLMARLVEGQFHDPPLVRRMVWNEVFARQGETYCVSEQFDLSADSSRNNGSEEWKPAELKLSHALFQTGRISFQCRHPSGGWVDVPEHHFEIRREEGRTTAVLVKPLPYEPAASAAVRIIAVADAFAAHVYIGRGTGISHQTVPIPIQPLLPNELRLQVGWYHDESDKIVWHDWERVLDFDESDASSFHFVVDEEQGVIRFSDGICGAAPPAMPFPNIRVTGYRVGAGAEGNVKEDTIKEMDVYKHPLRVTNLFPAYGGEKEETVKEALHRTRLRILEPRCGVTCEDLERRVREIPGLRIARVKAIPGYHRGVRSYPEEKAFGHISIVVVPKSSRPLPTPGQGMLATIARHLEPYRLLTTKLHIIPPEYIKVSVRAVIVVDPRYEGREWTVVQALNRWLQPYGKDTAEGWEFGHTVYKSDVYDIIHRVPGIRYIQDLWLMADGPGAVQEEGGDIRIPPHGLAISGEHDIEFITPNG